MSKEELAEVATGFAIAVASGTLSWEAMAEQLRDNLDREDGLAVFAMVEHLIASEE